VPAAVNQRYQWTSEDLAAHHERATHAFRPLTLVSVHRGDIDVHLFTATVHLDSSCKGSCVWKITPRSAAKFADFAIGLQHADLVVRNAMMSLTRIFLLSHGELQIIQVKTHLLHGKIGQRKPPNLFRCLRGRAPALCSVTR